MKYIRTKAGEIYDIDDLYICDELNDKPYGVKNSSWVIYKESIIKQANTIEELCDEFVVEADELGINKHYSHSIDETLKDAKRSAKIYKENYNKMQIIYGAVWTDKGLIYVAKMNDKGVLELL